MRGTVRSRRRTADYLTNLIYSEVAIKCPRCATTADCCFVCGRRSSAFPCDTDELLLVHVIDLKASVETRSDTCRALVLRCSRWGSVGRLPAMDLDQITVQPTVVDFSVSGSRLGSASPSAPPPSVPSPSPSAPSPSVPPPSVPPPSCF